jgi:hypothetical protein
MGLISVRFGSVFLFFSVWFGFLISGLWNRTELNIFKNILIGLIDFFHGLFFFFSFFNLINFLIFLLTLISSYIIYTHIQPFSKVNTGHWCRANLWGLWQKQKRV